MRKLRTSTAQTFKAICGRLRIEVEDMPMPGGSTFRQVRLSKASGSGRVLWQGDVDSYYALGQETPTKRWLRGQIAQHFPS